ncbi:MAG: nucleoside recognition domain-containing protein [Lachnospiraceae bacterium]|nr:nucleoside recognition protein [Lachnospiraceae bacterium]MDD6191589.1 nucleoside recognition domain-containing protein [Lachnospiraceae bacterium]MDY4793465.1 nucleoside recognition domain-containing protein [Pararoseburia sp.]
MNYLWAGMLLIGILYGAFQGRMPEITNAALDSAKEAVSLCITLMGAMCFWVGLMKIGEKSGLLKSFAKKMEPLLHFLFPAVKNEPRAKEYIATNMIANVFGLGWAATPAGLKAMSELQKVNTGPKGIASTEMCTFLVINISSLQLIPINMIAYRSQYGSANPTLIVGPAILATFISTLAAVIFCVIAMKLERKKI